MQLYNTILSSDNTRKYFFSLPNNEDTHVEACLLNLKRYGNIICVSSQIGCPQKCLFCAAGNKRFVRDLTSEEIQDQVRLIVENNAYLLEDGFQVTYMGSGEPLSNYYNVFCSINEMRRIYPALSRVNISTTCPDESKSCFDSIDWRAYKGFMHIQYSLHFTNDEYRSKYLYPRLMKISDVINYLNIISEKICDTYKINYILFDGLNDNKECVLDLCNIMNTTTNAILKISAMSDVTGSILRPSKNFEPFVSCAKEIIKKIEVFYSDGTDVNAGCGQFYNDSIL